MPFQLTSMTRIENPAHRAALAAAFALFSSLCSPLAFAADDILLTAGAPSSAAPSEAETPAPEQWALHGQLTNIAQGHGTFNAPYSGPNSLSSRSPEQETTDITLFAGLRLWRGAELWVNPEIDQGFGFGNTLGMAGFPNGGAYKVGADKPYLRIPRAFMRQTIALGGDDEKVEAAANQLAGSRSADNLTLTLGKFAVPDIFDTNSYAHDPRADFLNWTAIDGGAFDYAADSWGYTYGAAAEWTRSWWTLRAGFFQLSGTPNGKVAGVRFNQNSAVVEGEARYHRLGHPGKIKLLAFEDHGAMGSYQDALQLAQQSGSTPDVSQVRKVATKAGMVINLEQELTTDLGVFARYSQDDGSKEAYEFTDVNRSISAGLSLKGERWRRDQDTVGLALVANRISGAAQAYFAAGGLGVLVGDGQLNYAPEQILELYYALHPCAHITVTFDYQHATNPAYNQDRGPVSIFGLRTHAEF
jgi:high affinity Mn2+ porin